jgi:hypothetical protein
MITTFFFLTGTVGLVLVKVGGNAVAFIGRTEDSGRDAFHAFCTDKRAFQT